MNTLKSVLSGLASVSLVLAGAIGAIALHAPEWLAWTGIAITTGGACIAIGAALHKPSPSPPSDSHDECQRAIANVRRLHIARVQACADCPHCRAVLSLEPEIDAGL